MESGGRSAGDERSGADSGGLEGWLPPSPDAPTFPSYPASASPTYPPPPAGGAGLPGGPSVPPGQAGWPGFGPGVSRPANGRAITALVLGISGLALLMLSFGLLSFMTLPLGIAAIVFGVQGKRAAAPDAFSEPHKPGGRGMAQAGIVMGIVGTVLSLLALILFGLLLAFGDVNFDEFETSPSDNLFQSKAACVLVASGRVVGLFLA